MVTHSTPLCNYYVRRKYVCLVWVSSFTHRTDHIIGTAISYAVRKECPDCINYFSFY